MYIDKVKPLLAEVPKSWLANETSSDARELPQRAVEETLIKAPNTDYTSAQVSAKSADNELLSFPLLSLDISFP